MSVENASYFHILVKTLNIKVVRNFLFASVKQIYTIMLKWQGIQHLNILEIVTINQAREKISHGTFRIN